ncbi:MAG TPA: hypothetical protein VH419_06410, partial [Nocardioidaceae bacterium]
MAVASPEMWQSIRGAGVGSPVGVPSTNASTTGAGSPARRSSKAAVRPRVWNSSSQPGAIQHTASRTIAARSERVGHGGRGMRDVAPVNQQLAQQDPQGKGHRNLSPSTATFTGVPAHPTGGKRRRGSNRLACSGKDASDVGVGEEVDRR